jgi:hypothetical protein
LEHPRIEPLVLGFRDIVNETVAAFVKESENTLAFNNLRSPIVTSARFREGASLCRIVIVLLVDRLPEVLVVLRRVNICIAEVAHTADDPVQSLASRSDTDERPNAIDMCEDLF